MQLYETVTSDLHYEIRRRRNGSGFYLAAGGEPITAADDDELLFILEKQLTIELQKIRGELYFLHAAALGFACRGLVMSPPRTGKSTTTWALLHHGFDYLSDELAPLDLDSLQVQPYGACALFKKRAASYIFATGANLAHVIDSACADSALTESRYFAITASKRIFFLSTARKSRNVPASETQRCT